MPFGACAEIGFVSPSVALECDTVPAHGRSAGATFDHATEQVNGIGAAWVLFFEPFLGRVCDALLHSVPGIHIDDRIAIMIDHHATEFENADVDAIGEEGSVTVDRTIEPRRFVDLVQGGACSTHLEGGADLRQDVRIWHPFMVVARLARARINRDDGLTLEPAWRCARDRSLVDNGAQAILCIDAGLTGALFVADIDQGFDEAGVGSLGNGIGKRVDDQPVSSEQRFVVSRIIQVTRKTGIVPQEQAHGVGFELLALCDHALEIITSCSGGSGPGFVLIHVDQLQLVRCAIFLDRLQLAVDGAVLVLAATIAQVCPDGGGGGKGGGGREEIHVIGKW